ncbi:dipeptidase [Tetragenococcus koreensis]|uniref:Dipeptidase n=1 Tax=Tetragenococcus koreensis TaxID=290335 RepID=A0AAN4RLS9_9ENTE|nr:dipeptidase [Tetragenococcus koreensis]MCF1616274.1 dipeptidase [Tetragenococcus koreensis]MCF1620930.1 dipeptidase [Tetragenococcus koreensis]MCF1626138.1 dipeptidase [Tetragenococcus koreensis]MCF1631174.1 dipeptidase [Tetragenococcus koreensis]MCF1677059.1 dipeptidase [Tetragenococcus koreensis]
MNVVDMHCDTIMKIYQSPVNDQSHLKKNSFQLDIPKMQEGDYLLQNFAIFIDKKSVDSSYEEAKNMIDCFYAEMKANKDQIRPITHYEQILENGLNERMSALLTMEEGAPIEGSVEKLEEFYDLGVRMMTLTWNYPNEIGYPNAIFADDNNQLTDQTQRGLTNKGIEIVQRMDELGMIIDVSHGSDALVNDVLQYTKRPFVASHSNTRKICPHFRNLPDDLIKKIAERGGVIGINFSASFLQDAKEKGSLINAICRHARHLYNVGGIESIGLGTDFDGIPVHGDLPDGTILPKIYDALRKSDFSSEQVDQIFNKNVLHLYQDFLI